eukprot:10033842-Prorocentrum_lima.AAC.1
MDLLRCHIQPVSGVRHCLDGFVPPCWKLGGGGGPVGNKALAARTAYSETGWTIGHLSGDSPIQCCFDLA